MNFQTAYSQSFSSCRLYTEQGYSASLSDHYYSGVMTKIENDSSGNRYSTIFLDTQRTSGSNTAKDGDGQVSLGIANDGTPCFIPGNLLDNSFYSNKIALGTTSHRWKHLNAVDIYTDTIHFTGGGTMSSPTSGGGKITNYLATAESIDYGNDPTVSTSVSSDGKTLTFNFNIPQGKQGTRGERGYTGNDGKGWVASGYVTIKPSAAGTPTATTITYSNGSNVVVCAETTVPGTKVLGVGVSDISQTSCKIWLTRNTTNQTNVRYIVTS